MRGWVIVAVLMGCGGDETESGVCADAEAVVADECAAACDVGCCGELDAATYDQCQADGQVILITSGPADPPVEEACEYVSSTSEDFGHCWDFGGGYRVSCECLEDSLTWGECWGQQDNAWPSSPRGDCDPV